jgi:hypothetical protein
MTIKEKVLATIEKVYDQQDEKGLEKYGLTLDQAVDDNYNWQAMINEELIDAIKYVIKENVRLNKENEKLTCALENLESAYWDR